MTNIKIAVFNENHPDDKLTENNQDQILDELGRVFCGTPKEELPYLRALRLEGDALNSHMHQQSSQWLIRATEYHRLG
jgi:hypothetical protein